MLTLCVLSCSKDSNEPTPAPNPTPTPPTNKKATVVVTATVKGISMSEVSVILSETTFTPDSNGDIYVTNKQERNLSTDGKASFDVANYIGKDLYFIISVKATNEFISSEVKHTIVEGDNAISLSAEKKQVGAKIKVIRDGKPSANEEVYALSSFEIQSFETLVKTTGYRETMKETFNTKKTTDNEGVVTFDNLTYSGKYKFVIFGKNEYQAVDVDVDKKTLKQATINIVSEQPVKITITKNGKKVALQKVYAIEASYWISGKDDDFYKKIVEDETSERAIDLAIKNTHLSTVAETNAEGVAVFDNLKKSQYVFVTTTGIAKPKYAGVALTVDRTAQNRTVDVGAVKPPVEKGTLTLECTSKNPYQVVITNSTGKEVVNVRMEGKSSKQYSLEYGTYTIKVTQIRGYIFNPTIETYETTLSSTNKTRKVSFPE
ncbi:hypothetical protein [Capnocytophaga catalasegens]|uniref:Lipoprotein n=1 Tax=Capnocytophaga catalasegens TaxID=1004260 RepID=A0AAV5AXC3_9FLAO|nr:hypothetical protein [Capnocytophaga catalasegens]GIZ15941.1 hypothetical protein RCZ03_19410 [Capnocytophaga catalasegens]GJM50005.1 hypothetical protein RCZ15_09800 [Capnocytophaga catalasegens]GJM54103.1 hypothetical protein RCZ16_24190 [Capnocytophaga catalasegens]